MSDPGPNTNWKQLSQSGLAKVKEIVLDGSRTAFSDFLHDTHDKLMELAQKPGPSAKGFDYLYARSGIGSQHAELVAAFEAHLDQCFENFAQGKSEQDPAADVSLALVNHEEMEEDVAVVATRQKAEAELMQPLWELNQRMALLNQGKKPSEGSLPFAPGSFCNALRSALNVLDIPLSAKLVIYKLFERKLIPLLEEIYKQANKALIEMGVLPNLRFKAERSPQQAGGPGAAAGAGGEVGDAGEFYLDEQPQAAPGAASPAGPAGSGQAPGAAAPGGGRISSDARKLLQNIDSLQDKIIAYTNQNPGAAGTAEALGSLPGLGPDEYRPTITRGSVNYQPEQLVEAVERIPRATQFFAEDIPTADIQPAAIAMAKQQLVEHLHGIVGGDEPPAIAEVDMKTIDLVGMLFEYMLDDEQVPDCVKALLSHLHTPFLKIAVQDRDFFMQEDHPARMLLDAMADAGINWVGNDGSSEFGMLDTIRSTVRSVLDGYQNEPQLFTQLLMEFGAYVQKVELKVQLMEKRVAENARGEDRLRGVKQRVNQEVQQRIANKDLPSSILLLLLKPWSDYMAFLLLRYGDKSDSWSEAVNLIEDLLWGLELSDSNEDKLRWRQHYHWIESTIEKGFESIGYDPGKAVKLKRSIDRVYQLNSTQRSQETTPTEVKQKMLSMAQKEAGKPVDYSAVTEQEQKQLDVLRELKFGAWFEYKDGHREKLAWFNPDTLHFLFVDQTGRRTAMCNGLELAQRLNVEEVRIITESELPLVERTLESIYSDLNDKTQALE